MEQKYAIGLDLGGTTLKYALISQDGTILNDARAYASSVLERDPELSSPQNATLREELRKDKYRIRDYSKIS